MGHVLRHRVVVLRHLRDVLGIGAQDKGAADVAQGAPAGGFGGVVVAVARLLFLLAGFLVERVKLGFEGGGNQIEQRFAGAVDDKRIEMVAAGHQFGFGGNVHQGSLKRRVDVGAQHIADGVEQRFVRRQRAAGRQRGFVGGNGAAQQGLACFPAGEGIGIVRQQQREFRIAVGVVEYHRSGEAAQ